MLYEPRNLPEVTQLTQSVLTDDDLRTRLKLAAREKIERSGWDGSIERVRQIYELAIQQDRPLQPKPLGINDWRNSPLRDLFTVFAAYLPPFLYLTALTSNAS